MEKFNCFNAVVRRKKKDKGDEESSNTVDFNKALKTLQVKSSETDEIKSTSFSVPGPFAIPGSSRYKVKVMSHESPVGDEIEEVAYEGEDEHDENLSMKRDYSDYDLQAHVGSSNDENYQLMNNGVDISKSFDTEINDEKDAGEGIDMIRCGHDSDPGNGKPKFRGSLKLKRSCSNLETRDVLKKIADQLPRSKSQSFEEMHRLAERLGEEVLAGNPGSPVSILTHYNADKVMLKKHSWSQILPSRSRKLWWKLFLWSHRNLHEPWIARQQLLPVKLPFNQPGGYSSDTLEPNRGMKPENLGSPGSFTGESLNKGNDNNDNRSLDVFHGTSGLWLQNEWVAFSPESSSLTRVDEWVKELSTQPPFPFDNEDHAENGIAFPPSPEISRSPATGISDSAQPLNMNLSEEVVHANNVIKSLNSSSTVAHISGMGLKVIPAISRFSSLRSVNLSGNFIVNITPVSLPKGLHTLNLSRNKINTIEGLRELTRLRILDLSYNRISRIGQGLSNCTTIKELYLAGNKISDVEGMHRLLKLTILDLSFNKITTAKALGQLVANYNSLLALTLLGNPIQSHTSDDHLRKAVCGHLPKLAYLNKQPINPQKAREVATEGIAKAALGSSSSDVRRKAVKRLSKGGSSSLPGHGSKANAAQKSRHKLRNRTQHQSPLKTKESALASSSH